MTGRIHIVPVFITTSFFAHTMWSLRTGKNRLNYFFSRDYILLKKSNMILFPLLNQVNSLCFVQVFHFSSCQWFLFTSVSFTFLLILIVIHIKTTRLVINFPLRPSRGRNGLFCIFFYVATASEKRYCHHVTMSVSLALSTPHWCLQRRGKTIHIMCKLSYN